MSVYLNGELWHEGIGMHSPIEDISHVTLSSNNKTNSYLGTVSDLIINNVELSAEEVRELYLSY